MENSYSDIKTRFLVISDTHGDSVPSEYSKYEADVAIHCGDLTDGAKIDEFKSVITLLQNINASLKLVIAGNHDFTMDIPIFRQKVAEVRPPLDPELVKREYDEGTHAFSLANGASLKAYASPYTPSFGGDWGFGNWGFQYPPTTGHNFDVPNDVDIVITHGPPKGIMDTTGTGIRAGCPSLFEAVARARPRMHCFGHVHLGWGAKIVSWRPKISEKPSHLTDIDNGKSRMIRKLSQVNPETSVVETSHGPGDEYPFNNKSHTLFVNAAIEVSNSFPAQPQVKRGPRITAYVRWYLEALPTTLASYLPDMPKSSPIPAPLRQALTECFRAITRLVRPEQRRQIVLVGGAASIAHSSEFYTEDLDVAAPSSVLADIWERVTAGDAPNFSIEPDGKIAFDASQGFRVRIDLIEYGKDIVERIHVAEPFHEGSVASMSDLLRLRAMTVMERWKDGDAVDLRWLLGGDGESRGNHARAQ
ncbi:Metallo-dependent phosphatase-like protein [Aspergillus multicolor]|uniref:metallophosphatase domain-containing protein n=1 Tax=Aspergillus multicolor TaxID=41759 RepID=UPI003CCD89D8